MSAGSGRLPAFLVSAPPAAAIEIAADRVTGVLLGGPRGAWTIAGHASERLPEGTVKSRTARALERLRETYD